MRNLIKALAGLTPALAIAASSGANADTPPPPALSLNVVDEGESVSIELIAHSPFTQQVDYTLELVGASQARHAGSTGVTGGERHVLSRMRANQGETWCARVEVTEQSGASYTLKAGDCTD